MSEEEVQASSTVEEGEGTATIFLVVPTMERNTNLVNGKKKEGEGITVGIVVDGNSDHRKRHLDDWCGRRRYLAQPMSALHKGMGEEEAWKGALILGHCSKAKKMSFLF